MDRATRPRVLASSAGARGRALLPHSCASSRACAHVADGDFELLDLRRVERERALDTDSKDCFRTVNVSRSRTLALDADSLEHLDPPLPSMTLKWTRSVSPALNCGTSVRMLRCSRLSIVVFIREKGGPEDRRECSGRALPKRAIRLADDAVRRRLSGTKSVEAASRS